MQGPVALVYWIPAFAWLTLTAACAHAPAPPARPSPAQVQEIEAWRAERVKGLKRDGGWLQLAGLAWLEEGERSFGSAAEGDVVLPNRAPSKIGTLVVRGDQVELRVAEGVACTLGEEAITLRQLKSDGGGEQTPDRFRVGDFLFAIIVRGGRLALRWWDRQSPNLLAFEGIETYPIDPACRVHGRFEAYDAPRPVKLSTVIQTTVDATAPGLVAFELNDRTLRLEPLAEAGDEGFFFVFGDQTNGHETYGGGRFLYTKLPDKDGQLILDFNQAYNPPCAMTRFATCPVPRRENRLPVPIEAGEKRYHKPDAGEGDAH